MTLFKQIALIISIFLLVILMTVLTLNFMSANQAVQERLYSDAKNTATSLSLSLGTVNGDIAIMSTMINANFDSGNYLGISLVDTEDAIIYERKSETKSIDVPDWFLNIAKITAPVASANVSAGWSQVGILHVQSDTSYAYTQLYTIFKDLLVSFSLLALIGLSILSLLLAAVLKPLKRVQEQAEAVARNEFILQSSENIPHTKEFRDVVLGMNAMVKKVQAMFNKGNEELKRQKELEYIDPTTKLKNRKYLIDKLPEYLKIDASSKGGINMLIALGGVIQANEKIGHTAVDALFVDIANIFQAHASNYENFIVSRINATEFSILLPECSGEDALELAEGIFDAVNLSILACGLDIHETFLSIGLYEYNYEQTIAQLFTFSDNALSKAKLEKSHIHLEKANDTTEVMGKNAWREIINEALLTNRFHFVSWKAVDTKKRKIAHKVLSLILQTNKGKTYSYGQFMGPANQIGLSTSIYANVMHMMFKTPNIKLKNSLCSIRLSLEYLDSHETYKDLSQLLKEYAAKLPFRLIIEIPDKLARKNSELLKLYKILFEKYNIDTGIYEFIGESGDYQYLQELRPAYIKGETSYFLTQNSQTLSALRLITDTLGISLIATSVMDTNTLRELQMKDIHIIQGKATEMIELS